MLKKKKKTTSKVRKIENGVLEDKRIVSQERSHQLCQVCG